MMPTHEAPVEVIYPDGRQVRFEHDPVEGCWTAVNPCGTRLVQRARLTDAIEVVGARHGVTTKHVATAVWWEDDNGDFSLEHQEPFA